MARPSTPSARFPKVPVYLFYGDQVNRILEARDQVLDTLLEPEFRGENLHEYNPEGKEWGLRLLQLLPELAGTLGTVSFIQGAPKVAVVASPMEIYEPGAGGARAKAKPKAAKKAKAASADAPADPFAALTHWLEKILPQGGASHLILLAYEDESRDRMVDKNHPLLHTIGRIGYMQAFQDPSDFFKIEDAIRERRTADCIEAVRDLWRPGSGDMKVYNVAVRAVRFLLQAAVVREKRLREDPAAAELFFPAEMKGTLLRSHDFILRKYAGGPSPYRTKDLLAAYADLMEVYRALRPRQGAAYVPDARPMLERALIKLFASGTDRR